VTARSKEDTLIISKVAFTLELTIPLIKHPSEVFLSQLEEASIKLISASNEKKVVEACLSCLGSVVSISQLQFQKSRETVRSHYCLTTISRDLKKNLLIFAFLFTGQRSDQKLPTDSGLF
jgi:hypothetical protein